MFPSFSQGTAYCTGRGETVRPMPPLPARSLWIVKPFQGTSTPLVYQALNAAKLPKRDPHFFLLSFYEGKPKYFNDLEEAAFAVMPELQKIKDQLLQNGLASVILAGSGSAFFCFGDRPPPTLPCCTVFQARFISRPKEGWY